MELSGRCRLLKPEELFFAYCILNHNLGPKTSRPMITDTIAMIMTEPAATSLTSLILGSTSRV